jgi:hypothetical protein
VGPGAPEPLEAAEELVFLCHATCVTLLGERLAEPRPRGSAREHVSLGGSGRVFLCPGLGWRLRARRKPRIGSKPPSIGSLGLGRAPKPRVEVADLLGLGLIP